MGKDPDTLQFAIGRRQLSMTILEATLDRFRKKIAIVSKGRIRFRKKEYETFTSELSTEWKERVSVSLFPYGAIVTAALNAHRS